jgi:hypothetical protein
LTSADAAAPTSQASELLAIAARLESLSPSAGEADPQIQNETARLRRIAQAFED